jgi:hypothetical protein
MTTRNITPEIRLTQIPAQPDWAYVYTVKWYANKRRRTSDTEMSYLNEEDTRWVWERRWDEHVVIQVERVIRDGGIYKHAANNSKTCRETREMEKYYGVDDIAILYRDNGEGVSRQTLLDLMNEEKDICLLIFKMSFGECKVREGEVAEVLNNYFEELREEFKDEICSEMLGSWNAIHWKHWLEAEVKHYNRQGIHHIYHYHR